MILTQTKIPGIAEYRAGYHRSLRRILILVIVLIIYGSLYPWHFEAVHLAANPLWILFHAWPRQPFIFFIRDSVVNVALYVPLGFVGHLAFRRAGLPGFGIYGPVLLGLALSSAIELTQLLEPARTTSMMDVTNNVIGSGLGVVGGLVFDLLGLHRQHKKKRPADRGPAFLALCWVAWLLFPVFPVLGFYEPRKKIGVFLHGGWSDPLPLISEAAAFFAGALLITRAGVCLPRPWFFATVLLIPMQFFITGRQPLPAELVGALAGVALFEARGGISISGPTNADALGFLAVLIFRGLAPFHFSPDATTFDWIPFEATLNTEWQTAAGILLEKIFLYGAAVWLLQAVGMRLWRSVAIVAVVLAAIEIVQTHLPGRTPEITDPVLAVLIGFVLSMLSRSRPVTTPRFG